MRTPDTLEQLTPPPVRFPDMTFVFKPLEHFDYGELDYRCTCSICGDWRTKLFTLQQHRTGCASTAPRLCKCDGCKAFFRLQSAYLAALHRRDLYCESSWHAHQMEPRALGESFISWIEAVVADSQLRSDGWWIERGSHMPMAYWHSAFRKEMLGSQRLGALAEAVSGFPVSALTAFLSSVAAVSGAAA